MFSGEDPKSVCEIFIGIRLAHFCLMEVLFCNFVEWFLFLISMPSSLQNWKVPTKMSIVFGAEELGEAGETLFVADVLDGDGEGFGLADEDDEFASAGDAGIEKVSLEHNVLLGGEGNDDVGKFGALGFVDSYGVGEGEFVQFAEVVGNVAVVKADGGDLFDGVNFCDLADVAVEDFFVVVVFGLDDFVAGAELPTEAVDGGLVWLRGVEGVLEFGVEVSGAEAAAVHGAEDLEVSNGFCLKSLRDAVFDDVKEGGEDFFGFVALDEEKVGIGRSGGECRSLSSVDLVGGGNDLASGGLAEDFGESDDGNGCAGDEVSEGGAGADGWQLVDVANQEKVAVLGEGAKEAVHEGNVYHGAFVDDEQLGVEGAGFVALKPAALGIHFQKAVNGFCRLAGGFGHSFGGAAGGSAEEKGDLFGVENFEEGTKDGCFSDAGSAGDDNNAVSEDGGDCLNLRGR